MKQIIIVIFCTLYLVSSYFWLQLSGEESMGSYFALFMSTLNGIDHFIFSAIVSYFFGLLLVVCYIVLLSCLKLDQINRRIATLWAATYPMLVLFGIFLYQIRVFDSRVDLIYVIITSIVFVYLVNNIYEKVSPSVRNRTLLLVVAIAYIVAIAAAILPDEMKINWLAPKYSKTLFEVPAIGHFVLVEAQNDIIDVKIWKDSKKENSTLHFRYHRESRSDKPDSNCIFVCFYGNKVLFRPADIDIINYADYEVTDLDTVLYQYEDIEFQIYGKSIMCKQRINDSWEDLVIKKNNK